MMCGTSPWIRIPANTRMIPASTAIVKPMSLRAGRTPDESAADDPVLRTVVGGGHDPDPSHCPSAYRVPSPSANSAHQPKCSCRGGCEKLDSACCQLFVRAPDVGAVEEQIGMWKGVGHAPSRLIRLALTEDQQQVLSGRLHFDPAFTSVGIVTNQLEAGHAGPEFEGGLLVFDGYDDLGDVGDHGSSRWLPAVPRSPYQWSKPTRRCLAGLRHRHPRDVDDDFLLLPPWHSADTAVMFHDFEGCVRAVRARDARFDGWFFVAVSSTRIYCRPSCPAPPAKVRHYTFFATSAAAQRAGYRACKRCRPDASPGSPEWNVRADVVGRAMRLIADGVVDREGVAGLAARLGYSQRQVERQLVAELGAGPLALARAQRAQTARMLIESTTLPMSEIATAAGFSSIRSFNDTVRSVSQ